VQNLIVAKNWSLLGIRNAGDPGRVVKELTNISDALTGAIHEVREIAHNLRPYQLDRLGLTQALRSLAADTSASSTTAFTADIDEIDSLISPESSTIVYRIVQESVNNILTHSTALAASITVKRTSRGIDITVRDDGRGFHVGQSTPPQTYGFGLSGIDQRVRMLSGTWTIESTIGAGTAIHVSIPVRTVTP
jgi:signal transduction histidine kinase